MCVPVHVFQTRSCVRTLPLEEKLDPICVAVFLLICMILHRPSYHRFAGGLLFRALITFCRRAPTIINITENKDTRGDNLLCKVQRFRVSGEPSLIR